MSNKFEAIIFDLGGVILNLDYNLTIEAFKRLGRENFDQLYTQSHQDKIFDLYETGSISSTEFRNYMRQFFSELVSDEKIDAAWNAMLLDLPVERIYLLEELKKSYPIYLFSNTNDIHYHSFKNYLNQEFGNANLLEDTFNKAYFSHIVGVRKPNTNAFEKVLNEHQLNPEKTLFIDDSIQHIEGAKMLGIQTHHLIDSDIVTFFKSRL